MNYIDVIAALFYCSVIYLLSLFIFRIIIKKNLPIIIIGLITATGGILFAHFFVNSFGIGHARFLDINMLNILIPILIVSFVLPYSENFFIRLLKQK